MLMRGGVVCLATPDAWQASSLASNMMQDWCSNLLNTKNDIRTVSKTSRAN